MDSSVDGWEILDEKVDDSLFEHPQAVPLVTINNAKQLVFEQSTLSRITQTPKAKHLPVAVICIVGKTRSGKSFLLNYLLTFLYSISKEVKLGDEWWKSEEIEHKFLAKGGMKPVTHGIHIWNEPIIIEQVDKGKLAVLVVDTMGTNDLKNDSSIWRSIVTLSAMTSSINILNIKENMDPVSMEDFRMLLEYAKFYHSKKPKEMNNKNLMDGQPEPTVQATTTPFQGLIFLMRDWSHPSDQPFGKDENLSSWNNLVDLNDDLKQELANISDCFSYKTAFYLPRPDFHVMEGESPENTERNRKFFSFVREFFDLISNSSKLAPFRRHGQTFILEEFYEEFDLCLKQTKSADFKFDSLIKFQAEKTERIAMELSRKFFQDKMNVINANDDVWTENEINRKKSQAKEEAIRIFRNHERILQMDTLKQEFETKLGLEVENIMTKVLLKNKDLHDVKVKKLKGEAIACVELYQSNMKEQLNEDVDFNQLNADLRKEATNKYLSIQKNGYEKFILDEVQSHLKRELELAERKYKAKYKEMLRLREKRYRMAKNARERALKLYREAMKEGMTEGTNGFFQQKFKNPEEIERIEENAADKSWEEFSKSVDDEDKEKLNHEFYQTFKEEARKYAEECIAMNHEKWNLKGMVKGGVGCGSVFAAVAGLGCASIAAVPMGLAAGSIGIAAAVGAVFGGGTAEARKRKVSLGHLHLLKKLEFKKEKLS